MANTYKLLYQGLLPGAVTTLYTVPASTAAIIKHIRIVHVSGAQASATLYHNGTGITQIILPPVTIPTSGWGEFDGAILAAAADTIRGFATSAGQFATTIYGDEVT